MVYNKMKETRAVSVGKQSSGCKHPEMGRGRKATVDIFCTHYQHPHMDTRKAAIP